MAEKAYRIERDSMGEVRVPADALYGAQTQRAVENFPISGLRFPRSFLRALGTIKGAAAAVNLDLGLLEPAMAARNPAPPPPTTSTSQAKVSISFFEDQWPGSDHRRCGPSSRSAEGPMTPPRQQSDNGRA